MSNVLTFSGPVAVRFEPDQPLSLCLSGQLRDGGGVQALVSLDVADNPNLPSNLCDIVLEVVDGSAAQSCRVQTAAGAFSFGAKRVFVHRDLRVPMRVAVPPQPVSAGYRWRWRLGIFLARIPILRSWLS